MGRDRSSSLPRAVACAAALVTCALPAAAADARAPLVEQLVAFKSGATVQTKMRAASTRVRVEGRRCAVAEGTALASLLRARPGRIGLADYGACGSRAGDGGGLYVRSIRGEREGGVSGWVYKVGNRLGTAGAADPAGAFGRGRLRAGQRVTWFYCRIRSASCQRTLGISAKSAEASGTVTVTVRGYDDDAKGMSVAGATVKIGGVEAKTDAAGRATFDIGEGEYVVKATKRGLVPSFLERVTVR